MKKIKEFWEYLKNTSLFSGGKTLAYWFIIACLCTGVLAFVWNKYVMGLDISIF